MSLQVFNEQKVYIWKDIVTLGNDVEFEEVTEDCVVELHVSHREGLSDK